MKERKKIKSAWLLALSLGLFGSAGMACFFNYYYSHFYFGRLSFMTEKISKLYPQIQPEILKIIKEGNTNSAASDFLTHYGYSPGNTAFSNTAAVFVSVFLFLLGCFCFYVFYRYYLKKIRQRILFLTDYLEKTNSENSCVLPTVSEDEFSKLQDEIFKTVTSLSQIRYQALQEKNNYAKNLANIAHQLKTPITSISLSLQMMYPNTYAHSKASMEQQLNRLLYLEESLLTLSRMDAGVLPLTLKKEDVFTLLTLAEDNLYELFSKKDVFLKIHNTQEMEVSIDLDWTMEAIMNLMKNCLEAAPSKTAVHADYEKTSLYIRIRIWDEGSGFLKEDLPHIFERFYRGKRNQNQGVGIGLYLSKWIVERQNGVLEAYNLPNQGGCYEIRFYNSPFKI